MRDRYQPKLGDLVEVWSNALPTTAKRKYLTYGRVLEFSERNSVVVRCKTNPDYLDWVADQWFSVKYEILSTREGNTTRHLMNIGYLRPMSDLERIALELEEHDRKD